MKRRSPYINILVSFFILIGLTYINSGVTFANSALPPSVIIIVPGASEDVEVFIIDEDGLIPGIRNSSLTESKFVFYDGRSSLTTKLKFFVKKGDESFEVSTVVDFNEYHLLYTLDTDKKTLILGTTLARNILLICGRIGSTLIVESIVFWLFGFRNKKSWMMFLMINLVTQIALNIKIGLGLDSLFESYYFLNYVVPEFYVFMAEIFLFNILVKESKFSTRTVYVITANFASLFFGGMLIYQLL